MVKNCKKLNYNRQEGAVYLVVIGVKDKLD